MEMILYILDVIGFGIGTEQGVGEFACDSGNLNGQFGST